MTDRGWVSSNPPGNWRHQRVVAIYVHNVSPDLNLTLSGSPGAVDPGQQVTYTATVSNSGNGADANVAFQDLLPGKATLVSANATPGELHRNPTGSLQPRSARTRAPRPRSRSSSRPTWPGKMTDHAWVSANPPGNWQHERAVDTYVRNVSPGLDAPAQRIARRSVNTGQQVTYTATVGEHRQRQRRQRGLPDLLPEQHDARLGHDEPGHLLGQPDDRVQPRGARPRRLGHDHDRRHGQPARQDHGPRLGLHDPARPLGAPATRSTPRFTRRRPPPRPPQPGRPRPRSSDHRCGGTAPRPERNARRAPTVAWKIPRNRTRDQLIGESGVSCLHMNTAWTEKGDETVEAGIADTSAETARTRRLGVACRR